MKKILLPVLLVVTLVACQPDTPTPPPAPVVVVPPVSAPPPVVAVPEAKPVAATGDEAMLALAKKNNCFACHTLDKNLVGPAWNKVAAKYRGQPDAEAKLVSKVAKGGSGVWGAVAMPPNAPKMKEEDIKSLVRFILALK
jgi:cytochrome c